MKKAISILLIMLMIFSSMVYAKDSFSDINSSHWAYKAVDSMTEKGIVSGYPEGNFQPNKSITRAEFAKLVVYSLDLFQERTRGKYDDVSQNYWAYEYANIIRPYFVPTDDNQFLPSKPVTREEVAYTMVKALKLENSKYDIKTIERFTDKSNISKGFEKYVAIIAENGIMIGNADGTFSPKGQLTRAEVTQLLFNTMSNSRFDKGIVGYIKVPTIEDKLYNGETQRVSSGKGYNVSGNIEAKDVGKYKAILILKKGYIWSDGSKEPKEVVWSINKTAGTIEVSTKDIALYIGETKTLTFSIDDNFEVFSTSSNEKIAVVNTNNYSKTITIKGVEPGIAFITLKTKENDKNSETIKVMVIDSGEKNVVTATPRTTVAKTATPRPTVVKTATPRPTVAKTATPRPTVVKTATPRPTVVKTATPKPTVVKTATPRPTVVKTATPKPTVVKTPTPKPTVVKTATPKPTVVKTATPKPTVVKTATPRPTVVKTATPKPTVVKTATPKPVIVTTPTSISVPKIPDKAYTSSEQTVNAGTGYTLEGTTKATKVGIYKVIAKLKEGYVWKDNTKNDKEISWEITKGESVIELSDGYQGGYATRKAGQTFTTPVKPLVLKEKTTSYLWYNTWGDGKFSVKSSDDNIVNVKLSSIDTGETYIAINTVKSGNATITATISGGKNYKDNSIEIPIVSEEDPKGIYQYDIHGDWREGYTDDSIHAWIEEYDHYYITKIWVKDPSRQIKKVDLADLGVWGVDLRKVEELMKGKTNAIVACNGSGFSHPTFWPSKIGENFTPSGNLVITNGQIRRERPTETKATLLGILDDGTLRFFNNETYEKIKNSGTVNTIAFGGMSNYLIRDGVPYLGNGSSAAPRTAFGQIDNNNYVIIVTNARRSTNTPGYHRTLNEITEIGMKLNCRNLINCDGGGSSTLWMNGKTFHYSQARDGGRTMYGDDRFSWGPRPVADAIYFTSLNK